MKRLTTICLATSALAGALRGSGLLDFEVDSVLPAPSIVQAPPVGAGRWVEHQGPSGVQRRFVVEDSTESSSGSDRRRLAGAVANAPAQYFGYSTNFLAVMVGNNGSLSYDAAPDGIALPVYLNEYSLSTGALIQSIPLPNGTDGSGYRSCTLAKGKGANGWDYDNDGMPAPTTNDTLLMVPCFDVPAGQPIVASSPKTVLIIGNNGVYDTIAGFSGPAGFRYVASVTGTSRFYTVHQPFAGAGIHFLDKPGPGAATRQLCAPSIPGCGNDMRSMLLFPRYPTTEQSGSSANQLHTADRDANAIFRAVPVGVNVTITNDGVNNMNPLPSLLNETLNVQSLAFGETSVKTYLAHENITVNGTLYKSLAIRYDYKAAAINASEAWIINSVGRISDTQLVRWSFFSRARQARVYYTMNDGSFITMDFSKGVGQATTLAYVPNPLGSRMRAAFYPPTATNQLTASPTMSLTPSRTPSSSQTGSRTGSSSQTGTQTASSSQTASNSPTSSRSPSQTGSQTSTPSSSRTGTASSSATSTQTGTSSSSQTSSQTGTPSNSQTGSQTGTPSSSQTGSQTGTPSSSQTASLTASQTGTSSSSQTGTQTGTASSSQTGSQTGTPSSSQTATRSSTQTGTGSSSQTASQTGTPSSSQTASLTASQTGTSSSSQTGTQTGTPSSSQTASQTGTPSSSATSTPSSSQTSTGSNTARPTVSGTRTKSPTQTPSASQTASQTGTASSSQTGSQTGTPSSSATGTQTGTPSSSGTASQTGTQSGTPSSSGTGTQTGTASSSGTGTRTGTPSSSQTGTRTGTQTPSNSGSASGTGSVSVTASFTSTRSSALTPSGSPAATVEAQPVPVTNAEVKVEVALPDVPLAVAADVSVGKAIRLALACAAKAGLDTLQLEGVTDPLTSQTVAFGPDVNAWTDGVCFDGANAPAAARRILAALVEAAAAAAAGGNSRKLAPGGGAAPVVRGVFSLPEADGGSAKAGDISGKLGELQAEPQLLTDALSLAGFFNAVYDLDPAVPVGKLQPDLTSLVVLASPLPTPSGSLTATATPPPTASITASKTASVPSASSSGTPSRSAAATKSRSASATVTATRSKAGAGTPTPTITATPTATRFRSEEEEEENDKYREKYGWTKGKGNGYGRKKSWSGGNGFLEAFKDMGRDGLFFGTFKDDN